MRSWTLKKGGRAGEAYPRQVKPTSYLEWACTPMCLLHCVDSSQGASSLTHPPSLQTQTWTSSTFVKVTFGSLYAREREHRGKFHLRNFGKLNSMKCFTYEFYSFFQSDHIERSDRLYAGLNKIEVRCKGWFHLHSLQFILPRGHGRPVWVSPM